MNEQINPFPGPPMQNPESETHASGMAIAAMVLGIIGLCLTPLALVAIILGVIVLASNTPQARKGKGYATTGVVLGGVGIVIVPIVALLIAILLPAFGAARDTARKMQNSTQIRGIHQGMVTFSTSNRDFYPGLTSNGEILFDGAGTGFSGDGNTPQAVSWILLDANFMTPEYLISPLEIDPAFFAYSGPGPVTRDNYSYAMLRYEKGRVITNQATGEQTYAVASRTRNRSAEWRATLNSQAIMMSDRNTGSNTQSDLQSIHSQSPGVWEGSILWNDNHVSFERTHLFDTKYDSNTLFQGDHLFEEDNNASDALMAHD